MGNSLRRCAALLVLGVLVGAAHRAHASDAQVKKAMTAFVAAITDDPKTSAEYLTQCQLAIWPAADGVVTDPRQVTATDLVGAHTGKITWRTRIVWAHANRAYGVGFAAADVDALDAKKKVVRSLRGTAMLVPDGKAWRVIATSWGVPLTDAKAAARALAGGEPKVAPITDGVLKNDYLSDASDWTDQVKNFDTKVLGGWMEGDDRILIGTQPKEQVYGGADQAKSIAAWKMKLASTGGVRFGGPVGDGGAFWMVANITAQTTVKGKPVTLTYRALFLFSIEVMGEGGNIYKDLAIAHFTTPL
jgi:hypothetical protein